MTKLQIDRIQWRQNSTDGAFNAKEILKFAERYLRDNRPVLVECAEFLSEWKICQDWICPDGSINLQLIDQEIGNSCVSVIDCDEILKGSTQLTLRDFLNFRDSAAKLYLKDWHFTRQNDLSLPYLIHPFMKEDWLNAFFDKFNPSDDYRFVYWGLKGSYTPFHEDVLGSYSWSVNLFGRKRWILINHTVNLNLEKIWTIDDINDVGDVLEVIQGVGEILFVPSQWSHQVENLEETLSVNHNWCNAYNIRRMWMQLQQDFKKVKDAIVDCRNPTLGLQDLDIDWEIQCQRVLKANSGMDIYDFLTMCKLGIENAEKYFYEFAKAEVHAIAKEAYEYEISQAQRSLQERVIELLQMTKITS